MKASENLTKAEKYNQVKSWFFHYPCWHILTIPALGRQRPEDHEFEASLVSIGRPCFKKSRVASLKSIIKGIEL
jgi:hypothetical protein